MSCIEIEDHAAKFVKDYRDEKTGKIKNINWSDPDKRPTMEMKTVLRKLLAWADLSGSENAKLAEALINEPDYEPVDAHAEDLPAVEATVADVDMHPMNIDEARQTIGIVNAKGQKKQLGNCSDASELNYVYLNSITNAHEAAAMILREDFRMEPPAEEKLTEAEKIGQLGFSS